MRTSVLEVTILLPLLLLGTYCLMRTLSSWVVGVQLLIIALLFGGIIGARLGSGAIPILFRDTAIVLPLYVVFLTTRSGVTALTQVPGDLMLTILLVMAWMMICMLNPTSGSMFQLLIGLKVWIFYMPFIVVGIALAARPEAMFRTFRTLLMWGGAACAIGLLQSLLVRLIGYQTVMQWFFGDAAAAATQNFTVFYAAGGIYRIPGTFSFGSQYVMFLYFYLTLAMIETNADPDPRYRQRGRIALFMVLVASLLSGTKGALVTFPLFVVGFFFFGLIKNRVIVAAPVAVGFGLWLVSGIGVDVPGLFLFGTRQAANYGQGFVVEQIERGLQYGALGAGIGSSTGAARYAAAGSDFGHLIGLEAYYAKVAAELGAIGFVIFAVLFLNIAMKSTLFALGNRWKPSNAIIAPLVIFILFVLVASLKAWPLDVDPANVFFWLSLGLVIGVDRAARQPQAARSAPAALDLPGRAGVA